jgi:hypothetical protein
MPWNAVGPIGAGGFAVQTSCSSTLARHRHEQLRYVHPQQAAGEDWWADVLADPRARNRDRRLNMAIKQSVYRLADEPRATILVACSKCDWKAAYHRDELIASHGTYASFGGALRRPFGRAPFITRHV